MERTQQALEQGHVYARSGERLRQCLIEARYSNREEQDAFLDGYVTERLRMGAVVGLSGRLQ